MINVLLKQERTKAGLSQKQLGDKAGISFVTINRIEAGHPARLSIISKLFNTLGKNIVYSVEDLPVAPVLEDHVKLEEGTVPVEDTVPGSW